MADILALAFDLIQQDFIILFLIGYNFISPFQVRLQNQNFIF